jgi:hypothetical protein
MNDKGLHGKIWTDEEISTLVSMWPETSIMHIAVTLRRSPGSISDKAKQLRQTGLLKGPRGWRRKIDEGRSTINSIKPDLQDFDAVKMDYCRKHQIDVAQLNARLASDNGLAAELFRLAQAATLSVGPAGVPRRGSGSGDYSS